MVLASGAVAGMTELIENLCQAYISARTKDIEDATYRTVWFHMGPAPVVVGWEGGSRLRNLRRG
jgi:hypothetical protein